MHPFKLTPILLVVHSNAILNLQDLCPLNLNFPAKLTEGCNVRLRRLDAESVTQHRFLLPFELHLHARNLLEHGLHHTIYNFLHSCIIYKLHLVFYWIMCVSVLLTLLVQNELMKVLHDCTMALIGYFILLRYIAMHILWMKHFFLLGRRLC